MAREGRRVGLGGAGATGAALDEARAFIAAFAAPENARKGVLDIDGVMVERLHLHEAERLVAMADAIEAQEAG